MDPPLPQWFYDMDVSERVVLAARLPPRDEAQNRTRGDTPPPPYSEAWDLPADNPPVLFEGRGLPLGRIHRRGHGQSQGGDPDGGQALQDDLDLVAQHIFGDLDGGEQPTPDNASNPWLLEQPRIPFNVFWEDMLEPDETIWGAFEAIDIAEEEAAADAAIQLELSDSSMNELLVMAADLTMETLHQEEGFQPTPLTPTDLSEEDDSEVERDLEFATQFASYIDREFVVADGTEDNLTRLSDAAREEIDRGVQERASELYAALGRPPTYPGVGMRRNWQGHRPADRHTTVRQAICQYFAESAVATAKYSTDVAGVVQDREALILHDALVWEAARSRKLSGEVVRRGPDGEVGRRPPTPSEAGLDQSRTDRVEAALRAREERSLLEEAWHGPTTEMDSAVEVMLQNPGNTFFHHARPSRPATFHVTGTTLRPNSRIITEGMVPPQRLTRPRLTAGRRLAYDPTGREEALDIAAGVVDDLLAAVVLDVTDEADGADAPVVDGAAALEAPVVYGPRDRPRLLAPPPAGLNASECRKIRRQQVAAIPLFQKFGEYQLQAYALDDEFINSARERVKFWTTCSSCGTRNGVRDSLGVMHHHHHKRECPSYLLRREVTRTCFYDLCENNTEHATSVCPVLHRWCRPACKRRGHCYGQCQLPNLQEIFERWAPTGRYTRTGGCWGFLGPQTPLDELRLYRAGRYSLWLDWPQGVIEYSEATKQERGRYMDEVVRR